MRSEPNERQCRRATIRRGWQPRSPGKSTEDQRADEFAHPTGISAAGGIVWLAAEGGVARITASETPPTLTKIPLDFSTSSIEAFPGGVWVSELGANRVNKIC